MTIATIKDSLQQEVKYFLLCYSVLPRLLPLAEWSQHLSAVKIAAVVCTGRKALVDTEAGHSCRVVGVGTVSAHLALAVLMH